MTVTRNLVRNNAGSIVHRDNCHIAQRANPPLLPWDWADKAEDFGWRNGRPHGRMGDGSVYAIHWVKACKVCRPDLDAALVDWAYIDDAGTPNHTQLRED